MSISCALAIPWLQSAEFVLLHEFESLERAAREMALAPMDMADDRVGDERAEMQRRVAQFASEEGLAVKRSVARPAAGPVGTTILDSARLEQADLLAIWPRDKNLIEAFITGHVSNDILHEAQLDVLVLPHAETQ